MSECRRVTYTQLEILCEFLKDNRDLATGFNKNARAREAMKKMWQTISQTLNAQGDGAVKDWKGWSKYWNYYKSKLKRTIAKNKKSIQRTGGGPSDITNLSEIEQKFLEVLGESFGQGLPGIRIDPFELDGRKDSQISQNINTIGLAEASRDASPIQDAAPGGLLRDAALAGPSRDAALAGPSRDAAQPRQRLRAPRQRTRRRDLPTSQEAARKALIDISNQRASIDSARNDILRELLLQMKEVKEILQTRLPMSIMLPETPELPLNPNLNQRPN